MAKPHDPFLDECLETMQRFGQASARPMFGGYGVYFDGLFVAIFDDGVLYGKSDDVSLPYWQSLGSTQFSYASKGQTMTMAYFAVPTELCTSPAEFKPALDAMVATAQRLADRRKKPGSKPRP